MTLVLKIFIFIYTLFLSCLIELKAQKIDIENYENKAQAYAILSAQYSNDAYRFSRINYFLNSATAIKQNCDTALVCAQIAIEYADTAILLTHDSCDYGLNTLKASISSQKKAIQIFQLIQAEKNLNIIHQLCEQSMYAMANSVDDAYDASLFVEMGIENSTFNEKVIPRDVTRLESDEFSFMTVKELYGIRLSEIEDEIILLENEFRNADQLRKSEISKVILQLKKEEDDFFQKMKSSEDKLIKVRTELSEEMIKIVNKDIFTTEKKGFYNNNVPIPVDLEMPEGLIYRLQIGFFKSQLPSDHFDGIFPLSSQKVDETYYRYTAGNFEKYDDAKEALKNIYQKGYTDSFVVAYLNGEKVSINEALKNEAIK